MGNVRALQGPVANLLGRVGCFCVCVYVLPEDQACLGKGGSLPGLWPTQTDPLTLEGYPETCQ